MNYKDILNIYLENKPNVKERILTCYNKKCGAFGHSYVANCRSCCPSECPSAITDWSEMEEILFQKYIH